MNLSKAWVLYETDKRLMGYSEKTLEAYSLQVKLMVRYFGEIDIEGITTADLKTYLADTTGHLMPSSIGHRMRFIKSLFRWAIDEGLISRNPAAKLREPKQGHRIPKSISQEDIESLRIACVKPVDHVILELTYSTGCRIGEVHRINQDDIDWDNRSIVVKGKGDKEREVYFDTRCYIWLKRYLESREDDDKALIVTERTPHRMSIARIRERLKEVSAKANVKINVYPHRLRHSYAVHLLDNGAPMELIKDLLGHSKMETTLIYAQLSGQRRKELYRKYR